MSIPARQPIGEPFSGWLLQHGTAYALSVTSQGTVIAQGDLTVRYGVRFAGKIHLSIVPGLLVLDYGEMLTGEEAWEFILKRSNRHPRAEIAGYRSDGADDLVMLRVLDLAAGVAALVFTDAEARVPLAQVSAVIAPADAALPRYLTEYLPRFASLEDWTNNDRVG